VILWVAAALAFCADWNEPGQGMGALGGAIVGVIVINSIFSFVQVYRAERALSALEKLLPHQVRVLRNGVFEQRPAAVLVPGDVIALEAGDISPADCRLIEAFSVRVNNATVTGESVPLVREAGPCGCEDELHSTNVILAGTTIVAGNARAVVFATGMLTEFGKIAHLTQATREMSFPLQREIAFVSRVVAVLSVVLGGGYSSRSGWRSACHSGPTSFSRSGSSWRTCLRACCRRSRCRWPSPPSGWLGETS
jgi:sodium/potassium-transporting ATPase subunit alpha